MKKIIDNLPKRFQWTIHNCIAHPLMEVAFQLGFNVLSAQIHEVTQPTSEHQDLDANTGN